MVRIRKSHTGDNLARALSACLKHFGIEKLVFLSFFFKQRKKKGGNPDIYDGDTGMSNIEDDELDSEDDEAVLEECDADDDALAEDDGHEKAIQFMRTRSRSRVILTPAELKESESILSFHDATTLKEQFDGLVKQNKSLEGHKAVLERRVAARWNSDFNCLNSHLHFKNEVQSLTAISSNNLRAYQLTDSQWKIALDLRDCLEIFEEPTRLFSQAEVPLIADVLPLLLNLKLSLVAIRDTDAASDGPAAPILRVAAHAAILMLEKYTLFTEECEIYYFAIVMCPDRKLDWFKIQGYSPAEVKAIKASVIKRWTEAYAPPPPAVQPEG
ncbi:hypothetical protein BKA70DRAFT_1375748 [Coprinopsis sp. MPI-PUGE-AT-0042]|nr:hypothetical protein BKA70DRAFT_1375748 [Coprinopsis sp. MPI-PUGE-AT-0042]